MDKVSVREMECADLDKVIEVYEKVYNPSYISFGELSAGKATAPGVPSENAFEVFREELIGLLEDSESGHFVGVVNNEVVGFALASLNPTVAGHIECWLDDLGVEPEYQGKRIGRRLVENVLIWGIEKGAKYTLLESGLNNEDAHRLFHSMGFKELSFVFWKSEEQ